LQALYKIAGDTDLRPYRLQFYCGGNLSQNIIRFDVTFSFSVSGVKTPFDYTVKESFKRLANFRFLFYIR